jgi:ribosomal protein S27E
MIKVRDARFPNNAWLRACQECGNVQSAKSPEEYKSDKWRDVKCNKCKSESLDYGTPNEYIEDED